MAVYAATVTLAVGMRKAEPIKQSRLGFVIADVNVTNYNQTLAEITSLSKYFQNIEAIVPLGPSDEGYVFTYIDASKSLYAWRTQTSGVLVQASSDTDVGSVRCIAFGVL